MSGRAIEAAGDVDTLLLDKTVTITLGNRQADAFIPVDGHTDREVADAAQLASLPDETPEGRSIVILEKENNMSEDEVREIIHKYTKGKFLGIFGEETVSVLKVNLDLEGIL